MKIAHIYSFSRQGIDCTPVDIEVDVAQGLPACVIVGLPDAAVSESRDRVRSAITNSGFDFPRTRLTINLAPAHTKKTGAVFDVPIALAILLAAGTLESVPDAYMLGELALDGSLRPVRGVLPCVLAAKQAGKPIFIPAGNAAEAALVPGATVYPVNSLQELVQHCLGMARLAPLSHTKPRVQAVSDPRVDMANIIGQPAAKRALEIASSGHHNVLLTGPPGSGKTVLAEALQSILPPLNAADMLNVTMLHSLVSRNVGHPNTQPPLRTVHHTASAVAVVGGGNQLQPGEISLAHAGVLFFDELPEFRRDVIEALRQPLQDRAVTISRASGQVTYPADVLFIAAQNPCPCGYLTHPTRDCSCSAQAIERYTHKISGPLLDRIPIRLEVGPIPVQDLVQTRAQESSAVIRARVATTVARQTDRQGKRNSQLSSAELDLHCTLEPAAKQLLEQAVEQHLLSLRGYYQAMAVGLTIADMAGSDLTTAAHIGEAIQYAQG